MGTPGVSQSVPQYSGLISENESTFIVLLITFCNSSTSLDKICINCQTFLIIGHMSFSAKLFDILVRSFIFPLIL